MSSAAGVTLLLLPGDRGWIGLPAEHVRAILAIHEYAGGPPLRLAGTMGVAAPRDAELRVVRCDVEGAALPLLCPRPQGLRAVDPAQILPLPDEVPAPGIAGVVFDPERGHVIILSPRWLLRALQDTERRLDGAALDPI